MVVDKRCRRDASFPDQLPAATAGSTGAMFERSLAKAAEKGYVATVLSRDPWVVTYDHFLSAEEASAIISKGEKHWSRSVAGDGVQSVRTSSTAWCEHDGCGSDPVLSRVRSRIANLTGVPEAHAEPMQILRYEPGQFYRTHHDQQSAHWTPQGVRVYTFFVYLSDVEAGGGTRFTDLGITVTPKLGRAVLWPSVLDSDLLTGKRQRHAAAGCERRLFTPPVANRRAKDAPRGDDGRGGRQVRRQLVDPPLRLQEPEPRGRVPLPRPKHAQRALTRGARRRGMSSLVAVTVGSERESVACSAHLPRVHCAGGGGGAASFVIG